MQKVIFELKDGRKFTAELYPEYAPLTVEHFASVVKSGFYSDTVFHRIIPDFMAQAALPKSNDDKRVKGEFIQNGVNNTLKHTRGVLSMARSADPNSASTSFFICYTDCPWLDGAYAGFGCVTEGMDVIDSFTGLELTYQWGMAERSAPVEPPVIASATLIEE